MTLWIGKNGETVMLPPRKDTRKARKRPGRGNMHVAKQDTCQFVAIDGEGWDVGEAKGSGPYDEKHQLYPYVYADHHYTILAAYDGKSGEHHELSRAGARLTTVECLDFLFDISKRYPKAIMACYGASYDINQILIDLSREQCEAVVASDARRPAIIDLDGTRYLISYQARKVLHVQRFDGGKHYDQKMKKKLKPDAKFTLWDVIGFFQCTFAKAMQDWLGPNSPQLKFIEEWKAKRANFVHESLKDIALYNRAENEALVQMMETLVAALAHPDVDLKLNRWDGAGAVAAALYKKHGMKEHLDDTERTSPHVFRAARYAYSGGHIECFKIGYESRPIYNYDIRSAYPAHICELPSFGAGTWVHGRSNAPASGFTVVRSKWHFNEASFYPLFYRTRSGAILYPQHGHGWHWWPEFVVARDYAKRTNALRFEVCEWWHWKPHNPGLRPFAWVKRLFNRRAELKRMKEGGAAQIIIKLGLNSLYGKMAQQIGAYVDEDGYLRKPPYFQLEWAGFVTSATRAQAMDAALQKPEAIISIATDGVYSTAPLNLDVAETLGSWEASEHSAICIVMPGFYMHEDKGNKWRSFSRGFDKEGTKTETDFYRDAWERKQVEIPIQQRRLIGLRQSLGSDIFWPMRGCWAASNRRLVLSGENSKRLPLPRSASPHLRLCATRPRDNEPGYTISKMHDLLWKVKAEGDEDWDASGEDWEE